MDDGNRIKATETAFEILDVLYESGGATAAETATALEMSRAGVYKHLRTLLAVGAVSNQSGLYTLGPKFEKYGRKTKQNKFVYEHRSMIDDLSMSLDAPTNLWVGNGDSAVCLYTTLPNRGRDNPRRQSQQSLLIETTPGKTILSFCDHEQREILLGSVSNGMAKEIASQLQEIQERKLLIESLQPDADWVSIATPVLDSSNQPIGALEVVIPSERAKGLDVEVNIAGLIRDTANRIEVEMV